MLQNLTGMHAIVILAVVVLIFGAAKLPALAKSVGQSVRILKKETAEHADGTANASAESDSAPDARRRPTVAPLDTTVLPPAAPTTAQQTPRSS